MEQKEEKISIIPEQSQKRPEIDLSDIYLNLEVEAGKSFNGTFTVFSKNKIELEGKILSTNDKVVLEKTGLSGTECEIPFYFKGKLAIPGEEHYGDFLLITNGGEWNLPYCITVVPKKLWIDEKPIGTFTEFADLARQDWKKAKEAFFSKEFKEVFLSEDKEIYSLYQGLLKGRSKDVILDNFLQETTGKEPIYISVEEDNTPISLTSGEIGRVCMKKKGWGFVEGKIYSKNGSLSMNKTNMTSLDFTNDCLELSFSVNEKEDFYEDTLVIETVFQQIEIPVKQIRKKEKRRTGNQARKETGIAGMLRPYIDLRTGKISVAAYIEQTLSWLKTQENGNVDPDFLELCRFQVLLIQNQEDEERINQSDFEAYSQMIEKKRAIYLKKPLCRNYFYYLMALYKKDKASILEAALQIKDGYEKSRNFYDYWMLLYVDRNYALDPKGQCERMFAYRKEGENSPLLYLGLLDVLNRNPYYLEDLEEQDGASLIGWGIRHGYLSLELSRHFAKLTMKEKFYRKKYLALLIHLYEIRQDELYLMAICSTLIKGNQTGHEYHCYFEQALSRGLKIVGLNEYYLRSLDFSSYPILPQSLLLYFNYSNSLDAKEKAYLYTNILHYKQQYEGIYQSYLEKMENFVKDQMTEGRMNRYLQKLYEYFLPSVLQDSAMVKYLPNIIFKKKLVCSQPGIVGVYVCHDAMEEEVYVPLVNGVCQIETYSEKVTLYFADTRSNRYRAGIPYTLSRYLNENKYMELCLSHNLENKKVLLKWTRALDEKGEENEKIASMVMETSGMKNWMREKAVEQILDHYYAKKAMEDLDECLNQINYKVIRPSYRRTLMNYYMACNRMEDAYFGIELYGSDLVEREQLYLLTCVGLFLHKEEKDELLLTMAHRTFMNGKYNDEIILYLRNYFEGRLFDLLDFWVILKEKKMDTAEYEEKLLQQMLFTGECDEQMLDVLLSYLEKEENDSLADSMLDLYSRYYILGEGQVPDSFFLILEKQVEKGNPLSLMVRLSYLRRKAEQGIKKEEQDKIREFLEDFCQRGILFPFFETFESIFSLPPLLKEMTWISYYSEKRKERELLFLIRNNEGKIRQESVPMRELCPGFYYGSVYLLEGETASLEPKTGEEKKKGKIQMEKMKGQVFGSRKQILHQMEEKKANALPMMHQYEEVLSRMEEILVLLGEEKG